MSSVTEMTDQEREQAVRDWQIPEILSPGDRVVFSKTVAGLKAARNNVGRLPGVVLRVDGAGRGRIADIAVFAMGAYRVFESCRWFDDPELELRPHLIEEDYCGVFELAQSEKELRRLFGIVNGLATTVAELGANTAKSLAEIKATVARCENDSRLAKAKN